MAQEAHQYGAAAGFRLTAAKFPAAYGCLVSTIASTQPCDACEPGSGLRDGGRGVLPGAPPLSSGREPCSEPSCRAKCVLNRDRLNSPKKPKDSLRFLCLATKQNGLERPKIIPSTGSGVSAASAAKRADARARPAMNTSLKAINASCLPMPNWVAEAFAAYEGGLQRALVSIGDRHGDHGPTAGRLQVERMTVTVTHRTIHRGCGPVVVCRTPL